MSPTVGESNENTPLLARQDTPRADGDERSEQHNGAPVASASSIPTSNKPFRFKRWPSVLALTVLCLVIIIILVFAFVAPQIIREYADQALVIEPESISFESFSSDGVEARIRGDVVLDGSRVHDKPVRDLGRMSTWIAWEVETKETKIRISLPEYGDVTVGTATIPPLKMRVRDGEWTYLDFLARLHLGSKDGIRRVADDWISGKLGQLRIQGDANVGLKSGIFSFGMHPVSHALFFNGTDMPFIPKYNISKTSLVEETMPDGRQGLRADATITVANNYSLAFKVPPLGFGILAPNCRSSEPRIMIADARTDTIFVKPKQLVEVNATAFIRGLPDSFLTTCPDSKDSPLDLMVSSYVHGNKTTVFVTGSDSPSLETPEWISELLSNITVPVPVPGHLPGHLIKRFSLHDVHFDLPNFIVEPNDPAGQPRISAQIDALIGLPEMLKFPISVERVRANATVYRKGEEMGLLDLQKWSQARSQRSQANSSELEIQSRIIKAPLTITDEDIFSDVIGELLIHKRAVNLTVKADVDIDLETALGRFIVRKIPAKGNIPIKRKEI